MQSTHIIFNEAGDTSVLQRQTHTLAAPAPDEIQIQHTAIGVNFVDIYHRSGQYPVAALPSGLGVEAVGVVTATGSAVDHLRIGQRVAYVSLPLGAYSTHRNLLASRAVALPDQFEDQAVAALLLRGITAHMLFEQVHHLAAGQTVLIHAAAGGLGLVLTQWAKMKGANVIGTVGSADKAKLARSHGADHLIEYKNKNFVDEVMRITQGKGADFVVDGIGASTLTQSLEAAAAFGTVASVGQVAGLPGPVAIAQLGPKKPVALIRPGVMQYISDTTQYQKAALAVFDKLSAGLRPHIDSVLPLQDVALAHTRLASGSTVGALLLKP